MKWNALVFIWSPSYHMDVLICYCKAWFLSNVCPYQWTSAVKYRLCNRDGLDLNPSKSYMFNICTFAPTPLWSRPKKYSAISKKRGFVWVRIITWSLPGCRWWRGNSRRRSSNPSRPLVGLRPRSSSCLLWVCPPCWLPSLQSIPGQIGINIPSLWHEGRWRRLQPHSSLLSYCFWADSTFSLAGPALSKPQSLAA